MSDSGTDLLIGSNLANTSANRASFDDVMIWNRVLSAAEVMELYGAGVCADPVRTNGTIVYNGDFNLLQYCDGVGSGDGWRAMGPPGAGGAGCTDPSGVRGSAFYNGDYHVLQYCDGSVWRALGKISNPCDGTPSPGVVCADGTVYAGLSPDGNVRMYTTPADGGQFSWNAGNFTWIDIAALDNCTASENACFTGEANTAILASEIDAASPYDAAVYCDGLDAHGHQDWYLPAFDELEVLYANRAAIGGFDAAAGAFPVSYYWSSSEGNATDVLAKIFNTGSGQYTSKDGALAVRCVRK